MIAKRRDQNEKSIINGLKELGYTVQPLNLRDGPDLLVGANGSNYLFEVKNKKTRGKLSAGQMLWHHSWAGQVHTVYSLDDILSIIF